MQFLRRRSRRHPEDAVRIATHLLNLTECSGRRPECRTSSGAPARLTTQRTGAQEAPKCPASRRSGASCYVDEDGARRVDADRERVAAAQLPAHRVPAYAEYSRALAIGADTRVPATSAQRLSSHDDIDISPGGGQASFRALRQAQLPSIDVAGRNLLRRLAASATAPGSGLVRHASRILADGRSDRTGNSTSAGEVLLPDGRQHSRRSALAAAAKRRESRGLFRTSPPLTRRRMGPVAPRYVRAL
jgi:hypothetical protein